MGTFTSPSAMGKFAKSLTSMKDNQPGKLGNKASKEEFAHWRWCLELFVDTVDGWKGYSKVLEKIRICPGEVNEATFREI